jgi:hypothetical protein
MKANGSVPKCWAWGLAVGLLVFVVRGAAQTPSGPDHSYQLSDLEGQWTWTQDPWFGDFVIVKDANSYAGTLNDVYEGTYGDKIEDIVLSDNHISFTRDGEYGIQYWDGTLIEEEGVLKIVDGWWVKTSGEGGSFRAEKVYGSPVNLGPNVNAAGDEGSPDISADGMTLYFDAYNRRGGLAGWDIWMSQAKSPHRDFGRAVPLPAPVNSLYDDSGPCLSDDGLTLYFASNRPGGSGDFDIWVTTRKTAKDPWGQPVNVGPTVNSPYSDNHPSISADGLTLYFDSSRPDALGLAWSTDIYMTRRTSVNDEWSTPEPLSVINTPWDNEYSPDISSDGLTLYYDSFLAGRDLWVTRRADPNADWQQPIHLGVPFNTAGTDTDPSISADGSWLYFVSDRPGGQGGFDIWVMPMKKQE